LKGLSPIPSERCDKADGAGIFPVNGWKLKVDFSWKLLPKH
jgi:hypothetical protein